MAGWDIGVVVNGAGIVFGVVREAALKADPQTSIEQVMDRNVKTYRLNIAPEKAADYMRQQNVDSVLVTTSNGELVGLLKREEAERAVN
jgi:predicted transcriptional regulator